MTRKPATELIREGHFAAEVSIDLIVEEGGWSPYVSLDDAAKLDRVRRALKAGNIAEAARDARVFELKPIAV